MMTMPFIFYTDDVLFFTSRKTWLFLLFCFYFFLLQSLRTKMSFHVVSGFWIVMTRFVISGSGQVFSGLAESTAFLIVRSGSWSRSSAGFAIYQVRPLTQFDIKNYSAKCLNLLASTFAKKHQRQMN